MFDALHDEHNDRIEFSLSYQCYMSLVIVQKYICMLFWLNGLGFDAHHEEITIVKIICSTCLCLVLEFAEVWFLNLLKGGQSPLGYVIFVFNMLCVTTDVLHILLFFLLVAKMKTQARVLSKKISEI